MNETVINMYIEPALQRISDDDYDPNVLNFTWEVISFSNDILLI